eukprot:TRINITY_DN1935_c0_g2_i2.p1 TRINITY_DN1935_c0_g2~~TRINITY_DN1935_c0_g2_i2.p1  ORF type:complete len:264 (+),score=48.97 TRINITY_DN1935_c0_g2_i2:64-855(+)
MTASKEIAARELPLDAPVVTDEELHDASSTAEASSAELRSMTDASSPEMRPATPLCDDTETEGAESAAGKKAGKLPGTRSKPYKGIVSCIGVSPKIKIEGEGEFRFAYRDVKRVQNEGKPIVRLGDQMHCRLTLADPPKAVCLRFTRKPKAVAPALSAAETLSSSVSTPAEPPAETPTATPAPAPAPAPMVAQVPMPMNMPLPLPMMQMPTALGPLAANLCQPFAYNDYLSAPMPTMPALGIEALLPQLFQQPLSPSFMTQSY